MAENIKNKKLRKYFEIQYEKETHDEGGGEKNRYSEGFKRFINDYYLKSGSKLTFLKLLNSKKILNEYIEFVNKECNADLTVDDIVLYEKEYHYNENGETVGDAFERFFYSHKKYFHPSIYAKLNEYKFSLKDDFIEYIYVYVKKTTHSKVDYYMLLEDGENIYADFYERSKMKLT